MILKMIWPLHEVDIVVETEVRVDHDNPKRVNGDLGFHPQKGLEDVGELGDDPAYSQRDHNSQQLEYFHWETPLQTWYCSCHDTSV